MGAALFLALYWLAFWASYQQRRARLISSLIDALMMATVSYLAIVAVVDWFITQLTSTNISGLVVTLVVVGLIGALILSIFRNRGDGGAGGLLGRF